MSANPTASTLLAALEAAAEVAKLAQTLIEKNAVLTSALAIHAATLRVAPEPGPPPPQGPPKQPEE